MTVRETALLLLSEYESSGKYVNLSLSSHKTDSLTASERTFLTVLLYTTVERKITYDYIMSALSARSADDVSPRVKNILRLGLCQIIHIDSVPDFAAVNETVKLAKGKGERAFVNGVLRAAVRCEGKYPMPEREKNLARYLSVFYSFPQRTVKEFIKSFGEAETEALLKAFNALPKTSFSVNTLKIKREDFVRELRQKGLEASAAKNSSIGVKIEGSVNPCEVFGFEEGLFLVQDEASQIAVEALGVKKDDTVIDTCACPGGKSFAAYILSGGASMYAFDLHESKLSLILSGAERLGFFVNAAARDARTPDERLFGKADKVICDVPCSGLGVLAKKPDLRYKDIDALSNLPSLQLEILRASSKYLKNGGEMIYSTCTLRHEENSDVVNAFLSENADFELVDFTVGNLRSEGGMLTLLPHKHGTDGFFVAKLCRR